MMSSLQAVVQRRYHALLMGIVGLGFVLLIGELIGYRHYEGLQIVGLSTTVIGAVVAFLGISATGKRRVTLASILLVLSLAGLLGTWAHNGERREGERPGAGEFRQNAQQGQAPGGQQDQAAGGQPGQAPGGEAGPRGPRGPRTPPPPLAPLSLSGFCILGAVVLLGKRDDE